MCDKDPYRLLCNLLHNFVSKERQRADSIFSALHQRPDGEQRQNAGEPSMIGNNIVLVNQGSLKYSKFPA